MSVNVKLRTSIVFHVEELLVDETNERISPFKGENAEISIPREVLESAERRTPIRIASFLFRNMSGLLPESLEEERLVNRHHR